MPPQRTPWWHWVILIPYYFIYIASVLWGVCFALTVSIQLGGHVANQFFDGDADFDNLGPVSTFLRWVVLIPMGWVTHSAQPGIGIAGLIVLGSMALFLVGEKRFKGWRRKRRSAARWKAEAPMRQAEQRWGVCPKCGDRTFDKDQGRCYKFHPPNQLSEQEPRPLAEPVHFPMASTGKRWTRCPDCGLQYVGEIGICPSCDQPSTVRQGPC